MENNGKLTLKKLITFILIMLLLIIFVFYTLNYSNNVYRLKKYVMNLELIQDKVNEVRNNYKLWNDYNPNEYGNFYNYLQSLGYINANSSSNIYKTNFEQIIKEIEKNKSNYWNDSIDSILTNYFYFSPEDLNKLLDLKLNYYVIINFYTGNIIEKDGIYDNEKEILVHRQYDSIIGNKLVLAPIYNEDIQAKIEIVENKGLSQKIKIYLDSEDNNKLPDILDIFYYTEQDESLKRCSYLNDYTYIQEEKEVYFTASTTSKYSFIVEDSNYIQYKKIDYELKLCNPPILRDDMTGIYWNDNGEEIAINNIYDPNWYNYSSEEMKFANSKTDDGNYWVWIPRYSYKKENDEIDIEFVDNLSSLSTSKKALVGYLIHKAFNEDGEITGFWVSKFQANIENKQIHFTPGRTLTIIKMNNEIKNKLMTNNQLSAMLLLSKSNMIEVSNDLVHYSGGSTESEGFINNIRYSNTNNKYGVYDLICSENELTRESSYNEEGRFRYVIK